MGKKKQRKGAEVTPSTLGDVINHAYKNGDLSNDLYEQLVKFSGQDTQPEPKENNIWVTRRNFGAAPTPCEGNPDEVPQPSSSHEYEIVKEEPYEDVVLTIPTRECEPEPTMIAEECEPEPTVIVEECEPTAEEREPEPTMIPEECKPGMTHQAEEQLGSVRPTESGGQSPITPPEMVDRVGHEVENEARDIPGKRSNVFPCCTKCRRLGWAKSDERNILEDVIPGTGLGEAIVFFQCKTCSADYLRKETPNRSNAFASYVREADSEVEFLDVNPEMWRGTEAFEIARLLMGSNVVVLGDGKGRTCRKTHKVWGNSLAGDRLASVDVERYRVGNRSKLVLPYLEGGLF